jgi:hypothetical protein
MSGLKSLLFQYGEPMHSHVSLLTDYGLNDEFVGVMKCVITDMAPHVRITDITHGVPAFDVRAGSLALARAIQYVPPGIVIAVVDPGVGTSRRAIAIEVSDGRGVLMGPDNGLLASAAAMAGGAERVFELSNAMLAAISSLLLLVSSVTAAPLRKLANKLIQPALCLGSCQFLPTRRMQRMATECVVKSRGLMCTAIAN